MVVFVTVWTSLSLEEARGAQLHFARHTHKVFRVPHFTQRCDHLQNRGEKAPEEEEGFYSFHFVCIFATILVLWVRTLNLFLSCSLLNLQHISFNACQLYVI